MSELSARLSLPYLQAAQAQKHVTHNEALERLDLLVQLTVEAFDATTPPASPEDGQVWALGASPVGDWAMHPLALAAWSNGGWLFITPRAGWCAALGDELRLWTGSGWEAPQQSLDNLPGLGIMASHDPTNRLVVASDAALFTHAGGGHQLKINKAAVPDTASLLFQSGWSGRAEMGLAGEDDFSFKVSADGSLWQTAITIDAASGAVAIAQELQVSGTITGALAGDVTGNLAGNVIGNVMGNVTGNLSDGAIDNAPIGALVPAAGAFTALWAETFLGLPSEAVAEAVIDSMGRRLERLFRLGEDGCLACDLYASFTDTAGTLAAAWGESIARLDDRSGNARNATQASAALRPLLGRAPVAGRRNMQNNNQLGGAQVGPLSGSGTLPAGWSVSGISSSAVEVVEIGEVDGLPYIDLRMNGTPAGNVSIRFQPNAAIAAQPGQTWTSSAYFQKVGGSSTNIDGYRLLSAEFQDGSFGGQTTTDETATIENFERRSVARLITGDNNMVDFVVGFRWSGGAVDVTLRIAAPQTELGTEVTDLQMTGAGGLDITEAGLLSAPFLRFDLSDDVLATPFPDGGTFDVMLFGRQGSWIERGVVIAPAASLNVGPDTITGGPAGLLPALGDIVGWTAVDRTLTQAEIDRLMHYHKALGAGDLLEVI